MFWYNTTLAQLEVWNGTAWKAQNAGGGTKPLNAYAWGDNGGGRLGDNTITSRLSPVSVVGGFTDCVQISAGNHTVAIRANGTAWAWGTNGNGQLGDNTITGRSSPVSVVGGFTDWVQISAGQLHTAAIRANGTAWGWGNNGYGRLGDGTTTYRSSPVSVVGGFTNWVQISAGRDHTVGLRANGTAWAWGNNTQGKLGDNTTSSKRSPVSVVGGFTDWVQISAGWAHNVGLRANGTAWAWGNNSNGRLGDNTLTSRRSPVSVVGGFTDWVQIVGGFDRTAAIRANGTAWCWGYNISGQLGDNTTISKISPVSVVGGFTDWVQISAGVHTSAIRANGTAWAWGYGGQGRLGDNSNINKSSPVSVVGGFTDWVQVSAGIPHTAAIRG
jgi:alpha-tubulin suppressor-like RCC1 family protein